MMKLFLIVLIIIYCTQDVSQVSCASCQIGSYYSSQGICRNCPGTCKTCTSRKTCTSCIDGYYLNFSSCYRCSISCQTCTSSTTCSCLTSQYLQNNTCYDCPQGCLSCSSLSLCTNCSDNYYLNNNTCKYCGQFCANCSSIGCSSCRYPNMYMQNQTCYSCSYGCALCNNSRICLKCYQSAKDYCVQYSVGSSQSTSLNILIIVIPAIAGSLILIFVLLVLYRRWKRIQLRPDADRQRASSSNSIIRGSQLSEGPLIQWKEIEGQIFGEDCIICLQTGNSYLRCGHIFHPKCLFQWFKHKKWCPMCHSLDNSKQVTVICENCQRMGFKKTLSEVIEYRSQDIKICRNCKLKE